MRVEKFPFDYDYEARFPYARSYGGWEGGGALKAEQGRKFYLIVDEGTMADFLDEDDPDDQKMMNEMVQIIEFDTRAERDRYARSLFKPPSEADEST